MIGQKCFGWLWGVDLVDVQAVIQWVTAKASRLDAKQMMTRDYNKHWSTQNVKKIEFSLRMQIKS